MTKQSVDHITQAMQALPFFQEMSGPEREALAAHPGAVLSFQTGQKVVRQGDTDESLFVVLEGQLSVTRNKPPEVFLAQLVPGSIFGEVTLRAERTRSSSVSVDEPATILKVTRDMLDQLPPRIASRIKDQVIRLLVRRLDEMNNKLVQFIR